MAIPKKVVAKAMTLTRRVAVDPFSLNPQTRAIWDHLWIMDAEIIILHPSNTQEVMTERRKERMVMTTQTQKIPGENGGKDHYTIEEDRITVLSILDMKKVLWQLLADCPPRSSNMLWSTQGMEKKNRSVSLNGSL